MFREKQNSTILRFQKKSPNFDKKVRIFLKKSEFWDLEKKSKNFEIVRKK